MRKQFEETFAVKQGGTTYKVNAIASGAFEAQTRYSPAASPDIDIEDVRPADDDFNEERTIEQITEELAERRRRFLNDPRT